MPQKRRDRIKSFLATIGLTDKGETEGLKDLIVRCGQACEPNYGEPRKARR